MEIHVPSMIQEVAPKSKILFSAQFNSAGRATYMTWNISECDYFINQMLGKCQNHAFFRSANSSDDYMTNWEDFNVNISRVTHTSTLSASQSWEFDKNVENTRFFITYGEDVYCVVWPFIRNCSFNLKTEQKWFRNLGIQLRWIQTYSKITKYIKKSGNFTFT